jgi:hypothetical protein
VPRVFFCEAIAEIQRSAVFAIDAMFERMLCDLVGRFKAGWGPLREAASFNHALEPL